MALAHEVHRLEVAERGRADLAAVGFVAAVADQVDPELALGAFGGNETSPAGTWKPSV